jgi:putative hemolysin
MKKLSVLPLLIGMLIISACGKKAEVANPASVYCEENGGTLEIRSDAEGNQSGVCVFPDGSECDEWAYFNVDCFPGDSLAVAEPTPIAAATGSYANEAFGLRFNYPADWFGPDETIAEPILRVEVGSDVVYPYGTDRTEQIYTVPNSYYVTIQYSQSDQSGVWDETYATLQNMQDGEESSTARSKLIRIGAVSVGNFTGVEYIATLSDTAQTEAFYVRQVVLFDENNHVLSIMGSPNNVELSDGSDWRDAYRMVDEENADVFHEILTSLIVE